jgi:hypothetical protein
VRSVEWVVKGESVVLLLDDFEEEWYRRQASAIRRLEPGPERSAAVMEVRTVMDAKALLGARLEPPEA